MLANAALPAFAITSIGNDVTVGGSLTVTTGSSLGTVTAGTWNGTAIAIANGGTGAITAAAALANLSAEAAITAGTTSQYWRGDKTWQTLDKAAVGLGSVVNADTTTTANITDSLNKRFVTDAQLAVVGAISGTNTGDETTATIKTKLGAATTLADGYLTAANWNTFNNKQNALAAGVDYLAPNGNGSALTSLTGANVTGTVANATNAGNATTVTNGVYTTGAYVDPAWITSLASGKLTGALPAISGASLTGLLGSQISGNIAGNAANVTGTVAVANGGTGATTLTGLLKGNGVAAFTAAVAGTDYVDPSGSYADPAWITSLAAGKLTGALPAISGAALTGLTGANVTGAVANATTAVNFSGALAGEVTGNQGTTAVDNAAVIGKVLTGYLAGSGTVFATDSIKAAIQKIDGNDALKLPLAGGTMSGPLNMGNQGITNAGALTGVASIDTITVASNDILFNADGLIRSREMNAMTIDTSGTGTVNLGGVSGHSKAINIGTGAGVQTITVGNDTADVFSLNSSGMKVSAAGAISGITSIAASGPITVSGLAIAGVVHNSAAGLLSSSPITLTTDVSGVLPIANGGTGAALANDALNNLLPAQATNAGKYLATDGTNAAWTAVTATVGGAAGQVQFNNAGTLAGANGLVWSIVDSHLGIGDTTPVATLSVGNGDLFQVDGTTGTVTTSGSAILGNDSADVVVVAGVIKLTATPAASVLDSTGATLLRFAPSLTPVNYIQMSSGDAGQSVVVAAQGGDANVSLYLAPKGTGVVRAGGTLNVDSNILLADGADRTVTLVENNANPAEKLVIAGQNGIMATNTDAGLLVLVGGKPMGSGAAGYVRVGDTYATTPNMLPFGPFDLFVEGKIEVDDMARFDGATEFTQTANFTVASPSQPFFVTSEIPVPMLNASPRTYKADGSQVSSPHVVTGTVVLSAGTATVNLAGNAQFPSNMYVCTATDTTAQNAVSIKNQTPIAFDLGGTGTDVVNYICIGK